MTLNFDQLFPTTNNPKAHGLIKVKAEDFIVIEHHNMTFTETGEHLWLKVKKVSCNTSWVATQLSSACKVPARQVGFAGLKDRHAITQQWFSVQLPKVQDIETIQSKLPETIEIIEHHWHQSKLKRGQLTHNEFKILVRNIKGERQPIENNIQSILQSGAPNYFGPQRFGHQLGNIQQALDWFENKIKVNNRNKRSLLISSARSYIFNLIVASRIKQDSWNLPVEGDILQLDGSHSWFPTTAATPSEISSRLKQFDIHITAALWGEDKVQSTAACAHLENNIADQFPAFQNGFEKNRVKQTRRSMRTILQNLTHEWDGDTLALNFMLQPGAYATGVIREIINFQDDSSQLTSS